MIQEIGNFTAARQSRPEDQFTQFGRRESWWARETQFARHQLQTHRLATLTSSTFLLCEPFCGNLSYKRNHNHQCRKGDKPREGPCADPALSIEICQIQHSGQQRHNSCHQAGHKECINDRNPKVLLCHFSASNEVIGSLAFGNRLIHAVVSKLFDNVAPETTFDHPQPPRWRVAGDISCQ